MQIQKVFTFTGVLFCCIALTNNAPLSVEELKNFKNLIEGQGLYSVKDDVTIVTVQNFKNELYGKPYAIALQFYNSWCGFCQRFSSTWKALGTDIKSWKNKIIIAAIDCSDEDNAQTCRDFEVMHYPTLRYFHENYEEGSGNLGSNLVKGEDIYFQKIYLIAKIISEQQEGRGKIFPDLLPYQQPDTKNIFDDVTAHTKYAFLIVENPPANLGPQIILDLSETPDVTFKYVLANNTGFVNNLNIVKFPAVLSIDNNNNLHVFPDDLSTREDIRTAIDQYLSARSIKVPEISVNDDIFKGKWVEIPVPDISDLMAARQQELLKRKIKQMGDVNFQADLETALRYSLKHEVGIIKTISGEQLTALIDFISVLEKYFPFGLQGQNFLTDLKSFVTQEESVLGADITQSVVDAEQEGKMVFSSTPQWMACSGSSSKYRGYPCGVWKLFHYLTVNAAAQNENNDDANPREVLDAMHGYIKNFFGCSDCSQHFQKMAVEKQLKNVVSLDSSVLWLWMAHNTVNERLAGDITEDPEFPKIQYPLPERCPSCRNSDDTWNLSEVLLYVKNVYSNTNIRYLGTDTRISHAGLGGADVVNGSSPVLFKNLDKSMCFILYLGSFCLIIALIRMFLKRGYKKKMYIHDLLGKV